MDNSQSLLSGSKEEVSGAISAFEEILDAMPNDRVALQTLFEGYTILENQDKANHFLSRLAQTVAEEQDPEEGATLIPVLRERMGQSVELDASLQLLEELMGVAASTGSASAPAQPSPPPSPSPTNKVRNAMTIEEMDEADSLGMSNASQPNPLPNAPTLKTNARDISAELSLAWNILQAKVIDEEEYSSMVHDLSELANRNLDVPVSVLHVLQDRNSSSLEKVLQFIVKDTNTPYMQLSRFEFGEIKIPLQLPEDYLTNRGAVVFETMDNDAMVAILNPYDQKLCDEIKSFLKTPCHFFVTKGDEYDFAVRKILKPEVDFDNLADSQAGGKGSAKKTSLRLKKLD